MPKRRAHYCQRIIDRVLEAVALGSSLRKALEDAGPLAPDIATFWHWKEQREELAAAYERALKFQASMNADKILDLAERVMATPSLAPAVRVASDLYRWHAEMRDPAIFSPKGPQNIPAPPKTLKQMQEEAERLQRELGVEAQPGMVTAPKLLREKQGEHAPAPNLQVVNGGKE